MLLRVARAGSTRQVVRVFAAAALGCIAYPALATSWQLSPSVELSETYSDNITLQSAGQEESQYVTQFTPGLALTADGRRLDLSFNYRLQNLFYARGSNRRYRSNHQLQARMDAELMREVLFFDANASIRQQVLDADGNIGQGNIAISSGQTDVATISLSPHAKKRLGHWSMGELRYTHDRVMYPDHRARDSFSNTIAVSLVDAKPVDRWSWRLGYSLRTVDYSEARRPSERREQINLGLGYDLSSKISLNGAVGYEDHEYESAPGASSLSGDYWNLGLNWRPTRRTNVAVGGGRRFFGTVWNLGIMHRARRTTISGSYSEELSTRREYILGFVTDEQGNLLIDLDTFRPIEVRIPFDTVFIRKRGQLDIDIGVRKSTVSLGAYVEYRDYELSVIDRANDHNEKIKGGSINWRRQLGRRTSLFLGARLLLADVRDGSQDRLLTSRARLERQLGRQISTSAEVRRTERDRSGEGRDYTENLLTARLSMKW